MFWKIAKLAAPAAVIALFLLAAALVAPEQEADTAVQAPTEQGAPIGRAAPKFNLN